MKAILIAILLVLIFCCAQKSKEKYGPDLWGNWVEYAGRLYGKKIKIYA